MRNVYLLSAFAYFGLAAAYAFGVFGEVSTKDIMAAVCLGQMLTALVIYRQGE